MGSILKTATHVSASIFCEKSINLTVNELFSTANFVEPTDKVLLETL